MRADFPNRGGDNRPELISWERFSETFDERHLTLLDQDETAFGHESRFSQFVARETATPTYGKAWRGHGAKPHQDAGRAATTLRLKSHAKI
ncbi:MAG: hypothetical protein ACYCTF_07870 [Acidiferrobacter sp.]